MIKGMKTIIINQITDLKFKCVICLKEKELGKTTKGQVMMVLDNGFDSLEESICYGCALKLGDYLNKGYIDYLVKFDFLTKCFLSRLTKKRVCKSCSRRKIEFVTFEYYLANNSVKQFKKMCGECFFKNYLKFKKLKGVSE